MLMMNADRLLLFIAFCYTCVASNGPCEQYSQVCERHTLRALLGTSVLLPCNLKTNITNVTEVSWVQTPKEQFIHLTSEGHVMFRDPRNGRVKAFPNQCSEGNFSIRIDGLKKSDLGCYLCHWDQDCFQVELTAVKGTLSKEMKSVIYICASVVLFLLLSVGCGFCIKYRHVSVANSPPAETSRASQDGQSEGPYHVNTVYENDVHDPANQHMDRSRNQFTPPEFLPDLETQPNQSTCGIYPNFNQFQFVRMESQKRKMRLHTELLNRFRKASFSRHYYVNRNEFSQQQAIQEGNQHRGMRRNKEKDVHDYRNPIYNRSTDQLHQL